MQRDKGGMPGRHSLSPKGRPAPPTNISVKIRLLSPISLHNNPLCFRVLYGTMRGNPAKGCDENDSPLCEIL